MSDTTDFVGRGVMFPMRVDQSGSIALTDPSDVASAIRMVLSTAPGERVMRPQFGCAIWDLLFEPINANTMGMMGEAVRESISRWEPRVVLDDVVITPDPGSIGAVFIRLDYRIKATNDRRNLVYPFYVIPREDES
jgi:uncharacterized protein